MRQMMRECARYYNAQKPGKHWYVKKNPQSQLFRPIGTQCVMGVQSVRAKARRKLMHLSLRLAFCIRMELSRSDVDCRSFQAHPDKILYGPVKIYVQNCLQAPAE